MEADNSNDTNDVDRIEIQLIEQEHRFLKIIGNISDYGFSHIKSKRKASWLALMYRFIPGNSSGTFGTLIAILTLCITYNNNKLMKEQNSISESMVKSSSFNMTTDLMTAVSKELEVPSNKDRKISKVLESQLISLSYTLKPYPIEGKILSPEKAYLLYIISSSNLNVENLKSIYIKGNFQNCDFSNMKFNNVNLSYINLSGSVFKNGEFSNCILSNSTWEDILITDTKLNDCDFTYSNVIGKLDSVQFYGTDLSNAKINYSNLYRCNFLDATLNNTSFNQSNINRAYFFHTNLEDIKGCNINSAFKSKPYERFSGTSTCSNALKNISKENALNVDYKFDSIFIDMGNPVLKSELFKQFNNTMVDKQSVLLTKK